MNKYRIKCYFGKDNIERFLPQCYWKIFGFIFPIDLTGHGFISIEAALKHIKLEIDKDKTAERKKQVAYIYPPIDDLQ